MIELWLNYAPTTAQFHKSSNTKQRAETGLRQNFFTILVVNQWNGLPPEVTEAPTLAVVERRLDATLNGIEVTLKVTAVTLLTNRYSQLLQHNKE